MKAACGVGYNVQTAVEVRYHLIVAHEVTNVGHDRDQFSAMERKTRETTAALTRADHHGRWCVFLRRDNTCRRKSLNYASSAVVHTGSVFVQSGL
jgi:hypothetical protein